MTIDNETRRVIIEQCAAIREAIRAPHPGRKERAALRAVKAIEEVVK